MLDKVDECIKSWIKSLNNTYLDDLGMDFLGGKKLRANLILNIAPNVDNIIELASIVELIHLASLLHDDVIDDCSTRRGKSSINATYGSKVSIMLGDILYSKAFAELSFFDKEVIKNISLGVNLLSLGELEDVRLCESFNDNEDLYMNMIYKKTAVLIEKASYCAAFLAGKDYFAYGLYGKNLGLAFQIIDDILDISSNESTLGKPILNDYKEGKVTLPYIYLYNCLDLDDKKKLKSFRLKVLKDSEKSWVYEKFEEYGCIQKAYQKAKKLSLFAKDNVKGEEFLSNIVDSLLARKF